MFIGTTATLVSTIIADEREDRIKNFIGFVINIVITIYIYLS
jgi:hypothetical protein